MDRTKILQGIRLLLEGIGEDPSREGLIDTPERVANMIQSFHEVSSIEDSELCNPVFHVENYDDIVLMKNIKFSSFCEHHLMPFFGEISIAYLPSTNTVIGLSKLARIVNKYSKRLQLQERMTQQIADALDKYVSNHGIFIIVRAHHMCIGARGVLQPACETITRTSTGDFQKNLSLTAQIQQLMLTNKATC